MKEDPSDSAIRSLIPNHRKLLRSKAVVVNVAKKSGQGSRQVWSREVSASERSKSFWGAKPPQKLGWTERGRDGEAAGLYGFFRGTVWWVMASGRCDRA